MSRKTRQTDSKTCGLCGKQISYVAELNGMTLCMDCFHEELAGFVEEWNVRLPMAAA